MGLGTMLADGGLFAPFLREPAIHLYKLFSDEEYRAWSRLSTRLARVPRRTECSVRVHGWDLLVPDAASFLSTYHQLFVKRAYAFTAPRSAPRILDLGANIGLSVLFFKRMHPDAAIVAFEPDPAVFVCLEKNVHGNGFADVELIRAAAWTENTTLQFLADGADGGRLVRGKEDRAVAVEAIDLAAFVKDREFDFLKMDIEGAEARVLPSCRPLLARVQQVFVEYHSRPGEKQALAEILTLLSEERFRLHVQGASGTPAPFLGVRTEAGYDLMLNIFAWREP
jgi:FkbM family methyltransferase